MYELIANHTLGMNELVKKAEKEGESDVYRRFDVAPGERFSVRTREEAESLLKGGAASRPPVEVQPLAKAAAKPGDKA